MSVPISTTSTITSLTITNPLILYRSLLQTKQIVPDPAQHRLALHLQKLYTSLKDYAPHEEYGARLHAISRVLRNQRKQEKGSTLAAPGHPLRRNPLFAHLFSEKERRDTLALTRVLTNYEAAMNVDSPRGLLLHGEVGTGKSMMVDLLAQSLPNSKKRRWHFNTFMLEILARLEEHRMETKPQDAEYSLLWLAKDIIEKYPILFLDEFQLPDRAASKILSNLLSVFFQLGGVLIASSNRMPDELSKASGLDFSATSRGGFVRKWLDASKPSMFPANDEYGAFVKVLRARCEVWEMRGEKDWRRRDVETEDGRCEAMIEDVASQNGYGSDKSNRTLYSPSSDFENGGTGIPKNFFLASDNNGWELAINAALPLAIPDPIPWQELTISVYGRKVLIPRRLEGVTFWTFQELCESTLGPADYITLASTFHTLILDNIPVLHISQKNEARRLITLLDALYEARCKLVIRAEVGPDDLFFPEMKLGSRTGSQKYIPQDENNDIDAVYPETISEIYQDQTSPFRPNISSYTDAVKTVYDKAGVPIDFGRTSSFIGEDERFAYKRASSRLWEMCGARWHARSETNWWRPLPVDIRRWERPPTSQPIPSKAQPYPGGDVKLGGSVELEGPTALQAKSIERIEMKARGFDQKPPLKPGWANAWGRGRWGRNPER